MAADALAPYVPRSRDTDYAEYIGPGFTWGRILSTCGISIWSNDIKCKYMFMFPLNNLARKELTLIPSYMFLPFVFFENYSIFFSIIHLQNSYLII